MFPQRLLHDDEVIFFDEHPHWVRLARPVAAGGAVLALVVVGFVVWKSAPVWFGALLFVTFLACAAYLTTKIVSWRVTSLIITSDRVIYRSGILRRVGKEVSVQRVQDVTYYQGLLQRLIGTGSVVIESGGNGAQETLVDLRHPEEIQTFINRAQTHRSRIPPRDEHHDVVQLSPRDEIGRLEKMHARGIITDSEFSQRKADLLA